MSAGFETSDAHAAELRPLRVAMRAEQVYAEAREQVDDLPGWKLVSADDLGRTLVCRKSGGALGGSATITITCSGPGDLPAATVHVHSVTSGGLLARDRAHVLEFLTPFRRRVG